MTLSENFAIDLARAPAAARLFLNLMSSAQTGTLTVTLPEGSAHVFGGRQPGPTAFLVIHDWSACAKIMKTGDIGLAEAYRDHAVDIPDIPALLLFAMANESAIEQAFHGTWLGKLSYLLKHVLMNRNTRRGSKKNIHAHYDLGNAFYRLWLDPSMTYSSALFSQPGLSLEAAQQAKYDRLIRQLGLKAGDHVLEIGCGWGGFAERAALHHGVRVTGLSLSTEQLAWARDRVAGTPAEALCEFRYQDYRDVQGTFDAVVSIEMIEAVGESYWPSYFSKIKEVLKPGGLAGIQAITIREDLFADYRRSTDFIQQYIFPGGMLLTPGQIQRQSDQAGLTVLDMMPFGPDYAETLRRWRSQFETVLTDIEPLGFNDAFQRIWRFYYAYCEAGFDAGRTDVYQVTLRA